jgi:hypothetical protein
MCRHHDDRQRGLGLANLCNHFQARHSRHFECR